MKRYLTMLCVAIVIAALFAGCAQDETLGASGSGSNRLTIGVIDGAFSGTQGTRAMPTQTVATKFTIGDQIGIFEVKDGALTHANLKYTCDGSLWNGTEAIQYDDAATYYAYYPWVSDEDFLKICNDGATEGAATELKDVVNLSAADAESFFAKLIEKWTPAKDQSRMEDYNASDLMVSKGVRPENADKYTIEFQMSHQMGLCLLHLEETTFKVDDTYSFTYMPWFKFDSENVPCFYDGIYRYIVKPDYPRQTLVVNGTDEFTVNLYIKAKGHYNEHIVGGGEKEYQVRVGDLFYPDGSLTHTDNRNPYKLPVGIVAYVGNDDVTEKNAGFHHGLVIAAHMWEEKKAPMKRFYFNADALKPFITREITCWSDAVGDLGGLARTQALYKGYTAKNATDYTDEEAQNLTFQQVMDDYTKKYELTNDPKTAKNSGWFLPACGQSFAMLNAMHVAAGGKRIDAISDFGEKPKNTNVQTGSSFFTDDFMKFLCKVGTGHYDWKDFFSEPGSSGSNSGIGSISFEGKAYVYFRATGSSANPSICFITGGIGSNLYPAIAF